MNLIDVLPEVEVGDPVVLPDERHFDHEPDQQVLHHYLVHRHLQSQGGIYIYIYISLSGAATGFQSGGGAIKCIARAAREKFLPPLSGFCPPPGQI